MLTTTHLSLALLSLDSGRAADLFVLRGVDQAAQPATGGTVDRAMERAKLVAARRGDDVVGTLHLLVAMRDDPADPVAAVLGDVGAET